MDQSDHKIINGSHHFASIANRHTRGIFLERHITSVVQSNFNPPMLSAKTYTPRGHKLRFLQSKNPQFMPAFGITSGLA